MALGAGNRARHERRAAAVIDNNAFGVGAAAAVPTAGTPIARTVSPPRLTSPWSGALRKRYVISPVSPDGHGPEVTGSVAKLSGHLPTAASLVGSLSKNRHQTRKQVKQDVSVLTVPRQTPRQRLPVLPCHVGDPDLWFADTPAGLEVAKTLCVSCPIRRQCLAAALQRAEPWGVWGGEIFDQGSIVSHKRPRGRPRKDAVA